MQASSKTITSVFTATFWARQLRVLLQVLLFALWWSGTAFMGAYALRVSPTLGHCQELELSEALVQDQRGGSAPWWSRGLSRLAFGVSLCLATMFATCGSAFAAAAPAVAGGVKQVQNPAVPWRLCLERVHSFELWRSRQTTSLSRLRAGMA